MKTLPHSRRARILAWAFAPALALVGCGGYLAVDGYDAAYVDAPVDVEAYPSYAFNDGYVYDVNGRYYHNHGGRWVAYRSEPPEVARERSAGRGRPGRRR